MHKLGYRHRLFARARRAVGDHAIAAVFDLVRLFRFRQAVTGRPSGFRTSWGVVRLLTERLQIEEQFAPRESKKRVGKAV
jgi:hypothetical protein